jgi:hypothetical protein
MNFGRKVIYTDLSKNRPHKKHCAWAPTPPWENDENYRKLSFFIDFGVFNRAGKTVSKIGIYALPPLKREIYGEFINILIKMVLVDKLGREFVPF